MKQHIYKGKIIRLPNKKDPGLLLTIDGKDVYIRFYINKGKIPYSRYSYVLLKGVLDKSKILVVNSHEDIGLSIRKEDVELLIKRGLSVSSEEINDLLIVLGCVSFAELVDKLDDPVFLAKANQAAAKIFGQDKGKKILRNTMGFKANTELAKLKRVLCNKKFRFDIPSYLRIIDFFSFRGNRNGLSVSELLEQDPYLLLNVPGLEISRETILNILKNYEKKLGLSPLNDNRVKGVISKILWDAIDRGHSYEEQSVFFRKAYYYLLRDLDVDTKVVNYAIKKVLLDSNSFVWDTKYNKKGVYFTRTFFSEKYASERLAAMLNASSVEPLSENSIVEVATRIARVEHGFDLDEQQISFLKLVCNNKFNLLEGEAGSGKTSIVAIFCKAYKEIYGREAVVVAPTGTAALGLAKDARVDYNATIHRFAKMDSRIDDYSLSMPELQNIISNHIVNDLIAVEESGMMDIVMFCNLLCSITAKDGTFTGRMIFVGDPNQLPPVRPGRCFKILIELAQKGISGLSYTKLVTPYRQGANILREFANAIKQGNAESVMRMLKDHNDALVFIDTEHVLEETVNVANGCYANNEQISVLVQRRKSDKRKLLPAVDASVLNSQIKALMRLDNPIPGTGMYAGERVMCVRNDYSPDDYPEGGEYNRSNNFHRAVRPTIFNGTKGCIAGIVEENGDQFIVIEYDTVFGIIKARYYPDEIELYVASNYASTVHKMQGQGSDIVVLALDEALFGLDLLYTAVTRAKKKLIVISNEDILLQMLSNSSIELNNKLEERILSQLGLNEKRAINIREVALPEFNDNFDTNW